MTVESLFKASARERRLTIDPKHEEPPVGDWPWEQHIAQTIDEDVAALIWTGIGITAAFGLVACLGILIWTTSLALGRDVNGVYAQAPLHQWFSTLSSGKGLCCSYADGVTVQDPDWGFGGETKYWVRIDGEKLSVPDAAIVDEKVNRAGVAVVWPYKTGTQWGANNTIIKPGKTEIRCFLPGPGG